MRSLSTIRALPSLTKRHWGQYGKALLEQGATRAVAGAVTPQQTDPNAAALDPNAAGATPPQGPLAPGAPVGTSADGSANPTDNSSAFSAASLQAMAIHDIQTTGGKNLSQIASLATMFGPGSKMDPKQTLTAAQQGKASDISDANSYLDTAQQQLAALGGAQGPAGAAASIPVLGQFINPKAAAYNQTKIDIATSIAKALTGSKPAASVIRSYMDSLPSVSDTAQVAAQKIANVRQELANKGKNYGM